MQTLIRAATRADHDAIWGIFREVIGTGETYAFDPAMSREDALAFWLQPVARVYVAESDGAVVGSYFLKPNQPELGSHVANAGYIVSAEARGRGIGQEMGQHSLTEARRLGFRAMQFNFVVSTNVAAVKLWQQLGFSIVGTLPGAFRHRTLGFVDVYVMYQTLAPA